MSAIALIGVFAGVKLADWIKNKIRFFVPEEDAERDAGERKRRVGVEERGQERAESGDGFWHAHGHLLGEGL